MSSSSLFETFGIREYLPEEGKERNTIPFLLVPGWGMGVEVQDTFASEVAKRAGRSVFAFNYDPNFVPDVSDSSPESLILQKSQMVYDVACAIREKKTVSHVDVFAYSEGCLVSLFSDLADQDIANGGKIQKVFGTFCFVAPAGVNKVKSYIGILTDALKNGIQNVDATLNSSEDVKKMLLDHKVSCKDWVSSVGFVKGALGGLAPRRIDAIEYYCALALHYPGTKFIFFGDDVMVPMNPNVFQLLKDTGAVIEVVPYVGHFGFYTAQESVIDIFLR